MIGFLCQINLKLRKLKEKHLKCSRDFGEYNEAKLNKTFNTLRSYLIDLGDVPSSLNNLKFTPFEKLETLLADFEMRIMDIEKQLPSVSFNSTLSK